MFCFVNSILMVILACNFLCASLISSFGDIRSSSIPIQWFLRRPMDTSEAKSYPGDSHSAWESSASQTLPALRVEKTPIRQESLSTPGTSLVTTQRGWGPLPGILTHRHRGPHGTSARPLGGTIWFIYSRGLGGHWGWHFQCKLMWHTQQGQISCTFGGGWRLVWSGTQIWVFSRAFRYKHPAESENQRSGEGMLGWCEYCLCSFQPYVPMR